MSGFSPIVDPADGAVVGVIGVDVDAGRWNQHITVYERFSLAIVGLVLGILLV